ncbi:MAG: SUMF1/EgtB/PvdO family nonheme iron enzyme [Kiritimatiellae bacterium]|nr:SUMF1/EgtB/PvdO family nonheme iron enzyme [Kiritimatiellia bacterium]
MNGQFIKHMTEGRSNIAIAEEAAFLPSGTMADCGEDPSGKTVRGDWRRGAKAFAGVGAKLIIHSVCAFASLFSMVIAAAMPIAAHAETAVAPREYVLEIDAQGSNATLTFHAPYEMTSGAWGSTFSYQVASWILHVWIAGWQTMGPIDTGAYAGTTAYEYKYGIALYDINAVLYGESEYNSAYLFDRGNGFQPIVITANCFENTGAERSWRAKLNTFGDYLTIKQAAGSSSSLTVSSIAISGASSVSSGGNAAYTCTATMSDGSTKSVSPSWSITSGSSYASINSSGKLTANSVSSLQSVTIKAEYGGKSITKSVTITASSGNGGISVSPQTRTIPASGGTGTIKISCDSSWTEEETVSGWGGSFWSWSTMPVTPFKGSFTASYEVAANTTPYEREVTITFTCGNSVQTHKFTQEAAQMPQLALSEALDNEFLEFSTSGDFPWYAQTAKSYDGVDAACCSMYSVSKCGQIETTVTGPGRLSFWWYISGKSHFDSLEFSVDGDNPLDPNYATGMFSDFEQRTFSISAGTHKIKWECKSTDSSYQSGLVSAYLDKVSWAPKVTLNMKSGSGGTEAVYAVCGSAMPSITPPTRTGYSFGGYYTSTDGYGTQYYTGSGASARMWDKTCGTTLYAKWTANTYNVALDRYGGSDGTSSVTATYGSAMPSITPPTRTGYSFGGYYTSTDGYGTQYYTGSGASARMWDKTSGTTLYAWWIEYITVSFSSNGGSSCSSQQYTVGGTYGSLPTPVKSGFTFAGWCSDSSLTTRVYATNTVSSSVATLYAKWDTVMIRNVTAKQRYPWNGKVDVTYTVVGDVTAGLPSGVMPFLSLTASNRVDGTTYAAAASALSGDTGTDEGSHHVVWDLNAQGLEINSDAVVFSVGYQHYEKYCVIDLSAGSGASSYPVSYLAEIPPGGWSDEYKTTKLVLRLIGPGSFKMRGSYDVTLTEPFYCGVFEVTQKQYMLVTGSNPSYFSGDTRPVEKVSYNSIRGSSAGSDWPSSSAVDSSSFMGKLRARTGLDFDLPTEAQWEFACRAGATTVYYWGDSMDGGYAWYGSNSSSGTQPVGTKNPNAWGLYDMSGNVWEWCLDWYGSLSSGVTDPKGSSSGSGRVERGGSWRSIADNCGSSNRSSGYPSDGYNNDGFRLVRTLSNNE